MILKRRPLCHISSKGSEISQKINMTYFHLSRFEIIVLEISKEGSTKIVNFMTLGAGVLVLRCGHTLYFSYFSTLRHKANKLSM